MNRHVIRVARRQRAELIRSWTAAFLMALFMGVFLGRASHAQDAGTVVQTCGSAAQQYAVGATRPIEVDVNGNLCSTGNSIGAGSGNAGFVSNATPATASNIGSTGAVTASIAAAAGKFSYICGFSISTLQSATGATATLPTVATLVGGVTMTWASQHSTSLSDNFNISFSPCVPGNAVNTAVTVTSPANADATDVAVNVWGFQQ